MKRINIKGPIISNDDKWIYDWLDLESTAPKDITDQLPDDNSEIEVLINSGGGDVYAGSEIYTELMSYAGTVTVKVVGIAASAASVIAMAGDKVLMSPTAQMMIHNVSSVAWGDHKDFEKSAEVLESHDKSIANAYLSRTNKSQEELLSLMDKETWMDAEAAVENGFADEMMFKQDAPQLAASVNSTVLPRQAIEKLKVFDAAIKDSKNQEQTMEDRINKAVEAAVENALTKPNKPPKDEPENKFSRFIF